MGEALFTAEEAWAGGGYDLALVIGSLSDDRLHAVRAALWAHPDLEGCYLNPTLEPADQPRVAPVDLEDGSYLFGVASLPNATRVACGSCVLRERNGTGKLCFYLPMGSLENVYPVDGFPHGEDGPWRYEVDDWLASIGLWVARSAKFKFGVIGFEVSAFTEAEIAAQGVPAERGIGYLWPSGSEMQYHRRTTVQR